MKKKLLSLLAITVLVLAFTSCGGGDNGSAKSSEPEKPTIERSVGALADYLELKDPSDSAFGMIGAENGKKYEDGKVEIYEFDPSSDAYKDIEKSKTIMDFPVAGIKDGMILFIQDGYSGDTENLIKKFNEVEFK